MVVHRLEYACIGLLVKREATQHAPYLARDIKGLRKEFTENRPVQVPSSGRSRAMVVEQGGAQALALSV